MKDFEEIKKNKYIMTTLILMPLLFAIIYPIIFIGSALAVENTDTSDLEAITGMVPNAETMTPQQILITYLANLMLILFSMVPGIIPTFIASYSFVGEKLNKSMEPLLATPTTDTEVLLGKSLAVFLPTMLVTYMSSCVLVVLVDWLTFPIFNRLFFPNIELLIVLFLFAPAISIMSIELNVLVSSKVNDVRAAQQIGGLVVLPLVIILIASLLNIFSINPISLLLLSALIILLDVGLLYLSKSIFQREEILTLWK